MRNTCLFLALLIVGNFLFAQDSSTHRWSVSAGLSFDPVAAYHITGTDTSFVNALSVAPSISLRHSSGVGISYSPGFVTGGTSPGLYVHAVTFGIEQYDKETFDYSFNYSHYFFTHTSSVPYSPINNEIYGSIGLKKSWLHPSLSAGIGFGNNTETSPASHAYDFGASLGVSHGFSWDKFSFTPSLSINGGTNEYFSLLSFTKYIGHSIKSISTLKKGKAATAYARKKARNSTTVTSNTPVNRFELNNTELGLETSLELSHVTLRPSGNFYLPLGSASGSGLAAYWQLSFDFSF